MRDVHVAVDARMAFAGGIGRYVRNLLPRLASQAPEWRFTLLGDRARLAGERWADGANIRLVDYSAPIYSVREQVTLPLATPRDTSLFWAPHYNAPVFSRAPLVVAVHDVAHLRLESFRRNIAQRAYATSMFAMVRWRAAALTTCSEFTRREFGELVGGAERMDVTHYGIDASWFAAATGERPIAGPYFVFVGEFKPHKNLPVLLDAFAAVAEELDATLVLIGREAGYRGRDEGVAPRLAALGERARVLGGVSDEELRRYVQHATALVAPGRYEGFGFPPLEAMASGTPAIVARAGSLPEVCGDAALYFEWNDPSELAARLREVAASPELRRELGARGRARASRFDWDDTARRTRDVFMRVLNGAA